jgi:hypothetical protein
MAIKRNREKRVMEISQRAYIDMVLKKFEMADCKPVLTPMEGTLTKMDDNGIKPDREYMKLVGSLLLLHLRCTHRETLASIKWRAWDCGKASVGVPERYS